MSGAASDAVRRALRKSHLGALPPTQAWNYQGMGNNMVQRVAVTVRPA